MTTVMLPFGHVSWPELEPLRGDRRPVRRPRPSVPQGALR
jgi:hypothetical protein